MAKSSDSHTDHEWTVLIEGPKGVPETSAAVLDLKPLDQGAAEEAAIEPPASTAAPAPEPASRWRLPAYAPLAAVIAFAAGVGALAGASTTAALIGDKSAPVNPAIADAAHALQDS